ncbi:DUF2975 domain-containing protein [Gimesia sp.]|uniref:DUF2975 domain-containing protein n=1 Tax=Gimesia sp. TaxID=2024833 RepID=UPI003A8FC33C
MARKDRTSVICRILYYLCALSLWLLPAFLLWVWFCADRIAAQNGMIPVKAIPLPLPVSTKVGMVLVSVLLLAPTYWGLFALHRFLKACCAEDYLGTQNSRLLKRFALGLMGTAFLSPVCGAALSVLLTMHNPPGQRMLAINLSSNQIVLAAVGALIFLLANLLKRASLIAEEHAQIV